MSRFDVSGELVLSNQISTVQGLCDASTEVAATVTLQIGAVAGRTTVNGCGGTIDLTSSISTQADISIQNIAPSGRVVVRVLSAPVQMNLCRGQVQLELPQVPSLFVDRSSGCQFSLSGVVGGLSGTGGLVMQRNVDSTFGTIRAGNLGALSIQSTERSTLRVEASDIGLPPASTVFTLASNVGIPLSAIAIGQIRGNATVIGNRGFSNADADAFLTAHGLTGQRTVSNNQP